MVSRKPVGVGAWGSQAEGGNRGLSLCPYRDREGAFDSTQGNSRESSVVWPEIFHGVHVESEGVDGPERQPRENIRLESGPRFAATRR